MSVDLGIMTVINNLSRYFTGTGNSNTVISPENITALLPESDEPISEVRNTLMEVLDALMSNSKTGFFMRDLMSGRVKFSTEGGEEEVFSGKFFNICHDETDTISLKRRACLLEKTSSPAKPYSVKEMINADESGILNKDVEPERIGSPSLASVVFPLHRTGPAVRGADVTSLFFNAITPLEMSRCSPLIDIQVISTDKMLYNDGNISGKSVSTSLASFLGIPTDQKSSEGGWWNTKRIRTDTGPASISDLLPNEGDGGKSVSSAGMELFTSPQTMINYGGENIIGDWPSRGYVLDPSRPFMSLKGMTIRMQGLGQTIYSSKEANLNIVLHDRSRMKEIASLLATDQFGHTRFVIRFGWLHPDSGEGSNNDIGKFLGSLTDVGVYNLVSSKWTINAAGEVDIDLRLSCLGGEDIRSIPVITGQYMPTIMFKPQIERLAQGMVASKMTQWQQDDEVKDVIRGINVSTTTLSSPRTMIKRKTYQEIMEAAGYGAGEGNSDELKIKLEELIKKLAPAIDPSDIEVEEADAEREEDWKKYGDEINRRLSSTFSQSSDAYLNADDVSPLLMTEAAPSTGQAEIPAEDIVGSTRNEYVSFGKIAMNFIGYPLAMSGRYDEVQLMFYPLNKQAGYARKFTTASFPIHSSRFSTIINRLAVKRPNLSISSFLDLMEKHFFSKVSYEAYGLSTQYKAIKRLQDADDSGEEAGKEKLKNARNSLDTRLKEIYAEDKMGGSIEFRLPDLSFLFETVPVLRFTESRKDAGATSPRVTSEPDRFILRVHIYDEKSTPYEKEMFLLQVMKEGTFPSTLADSGSTDESSTDTNDANVATEESVADPLEKAMKDLVSVQEHTDESGVKVKYAIIRHARRVKNILKRSMPSFTFGMSNSPVESISMGSSTSGPMGDMFLLNSVTPQGGSPGNAATTQADSMNVIPSQPTINMLGCPSIQRGQQFFIDMGTGTTADNIYSVRDVTHTLGPGKFNTTVNLMFTGGNNVRALESTLTDTLNAMKWVKKPN